MQQSEEYFHKWVLAATLTLLLIWGWSFWYHYVRQVEVEVVVVDKYEGLKHGTTTFFVETCLRNDIKHCELDTFSRRSYDMINIGEQWTLEVSSVKY